MRTVRSSGRLSRGCLLPGGLSAPGGVVCSQGVCPWEGVCSRGGLLLGGWYPSMHWGRHPPPCGQTHACKNITFATSLRMVKILVIKRAQTYHLFCKRPRCYHGASKTQVAERPVYASVHMLHRIHWISDPFIENSITSNDYSWTLIHNDILFIDTSTMVDKTMLIL